MHFQQHIHELKESRVIATLWACINRRLKQTTLRLDLPPDTIHNLEIYYNEFFIQPRIDRSINVLTEEGPLAFLVKNAFTDENARDLDMRSETTAWSSPNSPLAFDRATLCPSLLSLYFPKPTYTKKNEARIVIDYLPYLLKLQGLI